MTNTATKGTFARIVLTTAATADEAERLARVLVEERLAACATLVPSVRSIYRWQGKIEDASETLLLIKTAAEQLPTLQARLAALHSYQMPEFLVLSVEAGTQGYLEWLAENLRQP
jgi:periplasmic divalent cation tolerance protein